MVSTVAYSESTNGHTCQYLKSSSNQAEDMRKVEGSQEYQECSKSDVHTDKSNNLQHSHRDQELLIRLLNL